MGVATGAAVITTTAAIPGDLSPGQYTLEVVANGIPSLPFSVTVSKGDN
jgi:tetrahydromethanopterin S-methyltransferase subunit C